MQLPFYSSLRNIGRDLHDPFCTTSYLCERFPTSSFITDWHCIAEEALAEVVRAQPTPHVVWRLQTDASLRLPRARKKGEDSKTLSNTLTAALPLILYIHIRVSIPEAEESCAEAQRSSLNAEVLRALGLLRSPNVVRLSRPQAEGQGGLRCSLVLLCREFLWIHPYGSCPRLAPHKDSISICSSTG